MPPKPAALRASDPPLLAGATLRLPSKKTRTAIALLLSGEVTTIKAAAARIAIRRDTLQKSFAEPHVRAFIVRERAKMLQAGTLRATARLLELVDCESDKTSLDAVRLTLGLDGVVLEERRHVDVSAQLVGYILDLRSPDEIARQESARVIEASAEVRHELSGPARQAVDFVPEPEPVTSFRPDARWSSTALPGPPVEPEAEQPREMDAFDRASMRQQEQETQRAARPAPLRTYPPRSR